MNVITNPQPCFICIYGFNQECELLILRIKLNKNDVSDVKCKFNSTFTRSFLISSKTDRFTLEFQINKWNEWRRTEQYCKWQLIERYAQGECFVTAQWAHCERWPRTERRAKLNARWAHREHTVNSEKWEGKTFHRL